MTVEIPEGTYCDKCDYKPADEERNLATTYDDHMGFQAPTFYCEDCFDQIGSSYEPIDYV
jgi:hypothetical protein